MDQTNTGLTIRPLCAADLDRLFDDRSRPFGEDWLERQARDIVYIAVAVLDGTPVGRIGLDFTQLAPDTAYLWSAHVEANFQSRGIGTAIFQHLEQMAQARGFRRIRLEVNKDNLRARQLYERLGYEVFDEGIGRWRYRDRDRMVEVAEDNWLMRKILVSP